MGKSIYKKAEKLQERMARKYAKKPEKPKTTNEILGLKSIEDFNKKTRIERYSSNLKVAWYFETFWEKFILVGLGLLGLVRIVQWIIGGI